MFLHALGHPVLALLGTLLYIMEGVLLYQPGHYTIFSCNTREVLQAEAGT